VASNKASLIKSLKKREIPIPKGATVDELSHRADLWLGGKGWLFRLVVPASRKPGHPVTMLTGGSTYWVPNSEFAHMIANSNMVFFLGRSNEAPKEALVIDVPKDFKDRWGVGDSNGNNRSADS